MHRCGRDAQIMFGTCIFKRRRGSFCQNAEIEDKMSQQNAVATFEENVKAKLKLMISDLIPEEKYTLWMQEAIRDFERNTFKSLVEAELVATYKAKIQEELQAPEWQAKWDAQGNMSNEMLKSVLIDNADKILASMMNSVAYNVSLNLQQQIQQYGNGNRY